MSTNRLRYLALAVCAAALSGCVSTGGSYHVENATGQPIPQHALADDVFLDGTGPTARRMARMPAVVERHYAEPLPPGAPTRAIARTRPTAIERADSVSSTAGVAASANASATTGSRSAIQSDPNKPFSEQWWQREKQEEARLKSIMNICRGC